MTAIVDHGSSQKRLTLALLLGLTYLCVVAFGSYFADSLSLAANAAHMVIHNGAIVIGMIATHYAGKSKNNNYGTGYTNAEALGGYTNAILLIVMAGMVISHGLGLHEGHDHTFGLFAHEGAHAGHDHHDHDEGEHTVDGKLTLIFGLIGFSIHLLTMFILHGRRKQNLCVHGAYMCIKYDVLSIILSIFAGAVVMLTGWHEMDLIVGLFIGCMLLYNAVKLLIKSGNYLLGKLPKNIPYEGVLKDLKSIDHIADVHNLILRPEGPHHITASAHLVMKKACINAEHWEPCQKQAEALLKEKYGISYCIFQLEKQDEPCDHNDAHTQA